MLNFYYSNTELWRFNIYSCDNDRGVSQIANGRVGNNSAVRGQTAQILDTTTTVLLLVPLLLLLLLPSAVVCLDSFSLWRDGEDGSVANWVPAANCSRTSSEKQNENISWE